MTPRPPGSLGDPRELLLMGHADSLSDDTLLSMVLGESRPDTVRAPARGAPDTRRAVAGVRR